MRTRTFIGLILLVAALIVASTPALLEPASQGVEKLGVEAGWLPDQKAIAKAEKKKLEQRAKASGDEVEQTLELKGFVVEEDGDLRDTKLVGDREVNERGRLEAGDGRVLLPGQKPGTDAYSPPFAAEDGVLLDIDGCPVFRPEADVAALLANEASAKLYADKVASADDRAACETIFQERIAIATAEAASGEMSGASGRHLAGVRTQSLEAMGIARQELRMLADVFGYEDLPDPTEGAVGTGAAATAAAGTGAAAGAGKAATSAGSKTTASTAATAN